MEPPNLDSMTASRQFDRDPGDDGEHSGVWVDTEWRDLSDSHGRSGDYVTKLIQLLNFRDGYHSAQSEPSTSNSLVAFRLRRVFEQAGLAALGLRSLRRIALRLAETGGRDLILLYHRVSPQAKRELSLVPTLSKHAFRHHLRLLAHLGQIVSVGEILKPRAKGEPVRFAITFDDDSTSHVSDVLPMLRSLNLPATFFLSGRALHALGPYWWELLEAAIEEHGIYEVCRMLDVPLLTPRGLVALCERSDAPDNLVGQLSVTRQPAPLDSEGMCRLLECGMEIGFHTLRHPVLPRLTVQDLDRTLTDGLTQLTNLLGTRPRFFAYPYGKANHTVATRTQVAGYEAAFTNLGYAIRADSDRYLLGRWDVRTEDPGDFLKSALLRLLRPGTGQGQQ